MLLTRPQGLWELSLAPSGALPTWGAPAVMGGWPAFPWQNPLLFWAEEGAASRGLLIHDTVSGKQLLCL